jgi:hypothetical protein
MFTPIWLPSNVCERFCYKNSYSVGCYSYWHIHLTELFLLQARRELVISSFILAERLFVFEISSLGKEILGRR